MPEKRSKLFVDSAVQGALVKRLIVHWFTFLGLSALAALTLNIMLGDPNRSAANVLFDVWLQNGTFFLILFALMPMFLYDTVKLSHRFAGPIFRFRSVLKQLAEGEQVPTLEFRGSDFWQDIANDYNRVAQRLYSAQENQPETTGAEAAAIAPTFNINTVSSNTPV